MKYHKNIPSKNIVPMHEWIKALEAWLGITVANMHTNDTCCSHDIFHFYFQLNKY